MYCPRGLVTLSPRKCANHLCRNNLLLCHSRQSPTSPETSVFGSREKLHCKLPTLESTHRWHFHTMCIRFKIDKKKPLPSIPIELNIVFVFVCFFFWIALRVCVWLHVKKKAFGKLLLNGATAWLHLVVLWSKCGGAESQIYSIFPIISHPHETSSSQSRASD